MVTIRPFEPTDAPVLARLFHDTVRTVNIQDYSPSQVQAWAPDDLNFRDWVTACSRCFTYVAEEQGEILGFAELTQDGHIGCFYCHQANQRRGIGRQLYQSLLAQAQTLQVKQLTVEASITAKPFFEALGFHVVQKQQVSRRQQTFINYRMAQSLPENPHKKTPNNEGPVSNLEG